MGLAASLQKKLDAATVQGGLLASAAALIVGFSTRDMTLSPPIWTIVGLAVIVGWAWLAIIARVVFARDARDALRGSRVLWRWFAARLALYFAAWVMFICWLVTLPIGKPWSGVTGRALILILAVSFLTSLIGQGAINSAVLIVRFRGSR